MFHHYLLMVRVSQISTTIYSIFRLALYLTPTGSCVRTCVLMVDLQWALSVCNHCSLSCVINCNEKTKFEKWAVFHSLFFFWSVKMENNKKQSVSGFSVMCMLIETKNQNKCWERKQETFIWDLYCLQNKRWEPKGDLPCQCSWVYNTT